LNGGHPIYIEGSDLGYSHQGTAFLTSLGCIFISNDTQNIGTMTGVSGTVGEDYIFPFTQNTDANYSVDEIGALLKHIAFTSDNGYSRTIAYAGANYSTIASTPILGGLEDTDMNSKADLVATYLGYLLKIDGVFRGVVTDINTGDPVQGATVNVGVYSGITNAYGLCAVEVPPGSYTISCSHPNYATYTYHCEIIIEYNDTYWMDIPLTPDVSNDDIEQQDRITHIYPNPCTSQAAIKYFMKSSGNVEIGVYNIKGQKVSSLVNEYIEPGYHEVTFNNFTEHAPRISSGIYFMKLETEHTSHIEKFIILE